MKNNTFKEIGAVLLQAEKILLYPHINLDGDALGSSAALCRALRKMGKTCYILIEDEIPANLAFLDRGYCTADQRIIARPDLSVCIDCGDEGRFAKRAAKFREAPVTVCIDHHATTKYFCDFNYVDSEAAAAGELIYHLLNAMNAEIDKEIGEAIFAAITTDTGNFQYSNTSKTSHEIVARLYDAGIDTAEVSVALYENVRLAKILIKNWVLETMSTICEGRGVIAYVTQEMLKETGAVMDETEGIVSELRSIQGVEIAALIKESEENVIRVSLRSKAYADVAKIAAALGGGGHARAAGCTLHCSLTDAFDKIKENITESFAETDDKRRNTEYK